MRICPLTFLGLSTVMVRPHSYKIGRQDLTESDVADNMIMDEHEEYLAIL
jgi:hypothetical protein